jgi:arylsulfatase A-like enzyme
LKNPDQSTGRAVVTTFDPGNHALSTRDWRYLRYQSGEEELYDIAHDPHEWHNLAQDQAHQAKLAELRPQLDAALHELGPAVVPAHTGSEKQSAKD